MFMLNNIAATLADKNITLMFENGSFLNTVNPGVMYNQLGDKLLFEINLFKSTLYPVLKYFKTSLDTAIKSKKPDEGFVEHKMFTLPLCATTIMGDKGLEPKAAIYQPVSLLKTYDSKPELNTEDLTSFFITEANATTSCLKTVLENMNVAEIKDFISTYCTVFYDNGSEELYPGRKSYREFGKSGIDAMLHLKELSLLWGYIVTRIHKEDTISNMSKEDEASVLKSALQDVESLIAMGVGYYESFISDGVVAFDDPKSREDEIKYIYILDGNLPKLIDRSSEDPYSAIYGSHESIVNFFKEGKGKNIKFLDDLVKNEADYRKYYNDIVKITATRNLERFVRDLRQQVIHISREAFNLYITPEMKQYTSFNLAGDFTEKVISYVESLKDSTLTSDSAKVASDVIGKILFDKTMFSLFLDCQTELDDIVENFDIKEEQETMLWVTNFLTSFLVNSLRVE